MPAAPVLRIGLIAILAASAMALAPALGPTVMPVAAAVALAPAMTVGWLFGAQASRLNARPRVFHVAWAAPAALAFVLYALLSVNRHLRFGSGAWDLGCHNHNIWLMGHFKGLRSTVLGGVNFMGDHFMPTLALFAPLSWTGSSSILLYAQALLLAAAAWPLALHCRRAALGPLATLGIVVAYLFGVGTQSTADFDFHEIAPVPLALLLALWGFAEGRRAIAYPALLVVMGCKESAILYAGAVGAWLALTRPAQRREGLGIAVACLAWFLLVVGVIQPRLLQGGPQRMIHLERFSAFGRTGPEIALGLLRDPVRAAGSLVSPPQKLATLQVVLGGFGFLPLLAPDALLLAVPNLLERFLADKPEMWEPGYHYSLVLTAVSGFAATLAAGRLLRLLTARGVPPGAFDAGLAAFLLLSVLAASMLGAPAAAALASFDKPYLASPEQTRVNRRAIALVPDGAAVVAQNHFLPHLAFRQSIWLPEEPFVPAAEYVLLDPNQSAWPRDAAHVRRLVRRLLGDPAFRVMFSERTTVLFSRRPGPSATPTPELLGGVRSE